MYVQAYGYSFESPTFTTKRNPETHKYLTNGESSLEIVFYSRLHSNITIDNTISKQQNQHPHRLKQHPPSINHLNPSLNSTNASTRTSSRPQARRSRISLASTLADRRSQQAATRLDRLLERRAARVPLVAANKALHIRRRGTTRTRRRSRFPSMRCWRMLQLFQFPVRMPGLRWWWLRGRRWR